MEPSRELPAAIVDYLENLEDNNFKAASQQFTEDCVYYHPPSYQNKEKVEGRKSLHKYFAQTRGPKDINHSIEKVVVSENQVGFLGHQTGEDTGDDYFISYAELEDERISFYMAGFLRGSTVIDY